MPQATRIEGKNREPIRWLLELGDEVIAQIDVDEYSFPFHYGILVDSPQFERFRRYFTDSETWPDEDPGMEAICGEVNSRGQFLLRNMQEGIQYQGVCLNHRGEVVWFRHGDPL